MLQTLFEFMFGCRHRHLSRVFTIQHRTYKVCFDCGREFDLPDVARAVGPRPVVLLNPMTAIGEPAGRIAQDLYKGASNVTVRELDAGDDPLPAIAAWAWGRA